MRIGAITQYVDVAQLTLYVFWAFFAGLVLYLRREDKREGYPLEPDGTQVLLRGHIEGFPPVPKPKIFHKPSGRGTTEAPQTMPPTGAIAALPVGNFPGAPLHPTGNPMIDGVGPASWTERSDVPDLTFGGDLRLVPLRRAAEYHFAGVTTDPRGMAVLGSDGIAAGVVYDVWIDEVEGAVRYLEVELYSALAPDRRHVLLPEPFVRYRRRERQVTVRSILAAQFLDVPMLRDPEQITFREEDRLVAYYGGGLLYSTPSRLGPVL